MGYEKDAAGWKQRLGGLITYAKCWMLEKAKSIILAKVVKDSKCSAVEIE